MAWSCFQIGLAVMMVITGSINTLSTKWADTSVAVGSHNPRYSKSFDHPFLQAVGMFIGEFSCLIVFQIIRLHHKRKGKPIDLGDQRFNPLIFLPAALCDMCATSVMYIGLNMTYASSFQMLRGSVIIFTALLSVSFLRRKIYKFMWLGMLILVIGLALVGMSDVLFLSSNNYDANGIISGDLLIIMAQIIVATQMVYEEKVVTKYNLPPLQAVGWEGLFGMVILGLLLIPMSYINVSAPFCTPPPSGICKLEDPIDAFTMMSNNWQIAVATAGNIISIAFFNFAGISVTKEISATTRMVLDSLRTIVIWVVSLLVQWQKFTLRGFFMQLAGFILLTAGMCIYNDLICGPYLRKKGIVGPYGRAALTESYPVIQGDEEERKPILTTDTYSNSGMADAAADFST